MITTLLLDLDGTLLDSDMDVFMPHYFRALAKKLAHMISAEKFTNALLASMQLVMRRKDHSLTNKEAFWTDFLPRTGHAYDELAPVLDEFYEQDFPKLRRYTAPRPAARPVVQAAFDAGLTVAIATQPVFPLAAIRHRLDWAGVAGFPYALITSYERMHSTKPDPAYYREICEFIARPVGQCMMIGNDPDADIRPAALAGLQTYWLPGQGQPALPGLPADHTGSLESVLLLIKSAASGGE
jgi:FMN phosphatase YigB (HAD superfamily)